MSAAKKDSEFMELGEALEIVYELANENALDYDDTAGHTELDAEAARQQEALKIVHDHIVNEHGID